MSDYEVYLVTDESWVGKLSLKEQVEEAIAAGVTMVQFRDKTANDEVFIKKAREIQAVCKANNVPFIINDNVAACVSLEADGIHVGQSDMLLNDVKEKVGSSTIVGVSVASVEQALEAQMNGADYIGVGAIFPTQSKDDAQALNRQVLVDICDAVSIPVVAIGGINQANVNELVGTGIVGVAVISAILGQDNISQATLALRKTTGQLAKETPHREEIAKVLSIAGSDCSGGAGIQADMKTFMAHDCYGMSVITALTAQNTQGVYGIETCSDAFVKEQINAVYTDIRPQAVKIGMVASASLIQTIAKALEEHKGENIVVDPVMVATSGSKLLQDDAIEALKDFLLPLATVITPNLHEAELLAGMTIQTKDDMVAAAKIIANYSQGAILVKGGHSIHDADDLLYVEGRAYWIKGKRIDNDNTHGTGCTLSSAIASNLSRGRGVYESVVRSKKYITQALCAQLDLGEGSGPLDHGCNLIR